MINIDVITTKEEDESGYFKYCDGENCPHNPDYMLGINYKYRFKPGTKFVVLLNKTARNSSGMSGITYYCLDCAQELFKYIKINLDPNLWIFK
jgi:hypothetical protein